MEEREKIRTSLSQRETEVKELMKQVTSLKDTLATQQRKSRSKIDALAEVSIGSIQFISGVSVRCIEVGLVLRQMLDLFTVQRLKLFFLQRLDLFFIKRLDLVTLLRLDLFFLQRMDLFFI